MAIKLWEFWKCPQGPFHPQSIVAKVHIWRTQAKDRQLIHLKIRCQEKKSLTQTILNMCYQKQRHFFFLIAFPLFYSIENQSFTDQSEWETLRHSKGETRGPYLHKAYNVFGEKEDSNTCINLQSVQDSPCWDSSMKCCESSGGKKKSIFTQKYTHSVYIATRALCHLHRIPG